MLKNMKDYTCHIGLELRAYPSFRQIRVMKKNGGAANFIYNRLVAIDRERWRLRKTAPYSMADQARLIYLDSLRESYTSFEEAVPFLADKEIDTDMVRQSFVAYRVAWKNCREHRAGIPAFHKRGNEWAYRTSNHYKKAVLDGFDICGLYKGTIRFLDESHIMLPKIGRIRVKGSKKLLKALFARTSETRIGSVSITYDTTGKAYIHLALASDEPFYTPYPQTGRIVGTDLNLTNFLYDSDGVEISSPKYLHKAEKKLKKAQRKLSRKYEAAKRDHRNCYESKNYHELRIKLAKMHKHVANQRRDFIRKTANAEVKSHDFLFAEDLKVRNLKKNHKLAKAISDSGWCMFLTELQWCAEKRGRTCLLIDPHNTTQTCSNCGHVMKGDSRITLGTEEWTCPVCGAHHIRDYNAAVNIKNAGAAKLRELGVPIPVI